MIKEHSKNGPIIWVSRCPPWDKTVIEIRHAQDVEDLSDDVKKAETGFSDARF